MCQPTFVVTLVMFVRLYLVTIKLFILQLMCVLQFEFQAIRMKKIVVKMEDIYVTEYQPHLFVLTDITATVVLRRPGTVSLLSEVFAVAATLALIWGLISSNIM